MPDEDKAKPKVGEARSFKAGEADGYQTDAFSRGDAEGVPAPQSGPDEVADDPHALEAGGAGGYQTDTFSRGDEEGVPQEDLARKDLGNAAAKGVLRPEDKPDDKRHKAVDDADSRDAPPMAGPEGGVR